MNTEQANVAKEQHVPNEPADVVHTPALDLVLIFAERKGFIARITAAVMVTGLLIALLMKPVYTATAVIMPPQAAQSSLSSMLGQLGGLSSLAGAGNLLKNPADLYIGIMHGRTISDQVIRHFALQQRWHAKTMTTARRRLERTAQFESSKDGMIMISVEDHDPKFSSDVANYYVEALYQANSSLAITEAAQRRLFFEKELTDARTSLSEAEDDLKRTQQRTGVITVAGQTELVFRNIAQTRAAISSREVELQGLRTYASDSNPEVTRVQHELQALQAQLATQESSQKNTVSGNPELAAGTVPEGGLEYARKYREVKYRETLFELLSRQYEAARIDEAKSAPVIQVVDRAVPPDQKSGPSRMLITLGAGVVGFVLACGWVALQAALAHARRQPYTAEKLRLLKLRLPLLPL